MRTIDCLPDCIDAISDFIIKLNKEQRDISKILIVSNCLQTHNYVKPIFEDNLKFHIKLPKEITCMYQHSECRNLMHSAPKNIIINYNVILFIENDEAVMVVKNRYGPNGSLGFNGEIYE